MKTIEFNRKDYKSYKEFYEFIYKELQGDKDMNWEDYKNLNYDADMLYEFICECKNFNINFMFYNFDLSEIKQQKTFEEYNWNMILQCIIDFVENYPNNSLQFK